MRWAGIENCVKIVPSGKNRLIMLVGGAALMIYLNTLGRLMRAKKLYLVIGILRVLRRVFVQNQTFAVLDSKTND